jgi:hypothetical protein
VKIVHAVVAAAEMPAEILDMMTEMVMGQQVCYLPVVPLEPLGCLIDLQRQARVHSFHKNGRPPPYLTHKIDNVA